MRNMALALLLGIGVAAGGAASAAQSGPYGAVMGSYVSPDNYRKDNFGIGGQIVVLGVPLDEHFNVEFGGFANTLHRAVDHKSDAQYGFGLDAMVPLLTGKFSPFLLAGGGGLYERQRYAVNRDELGPYINLGGGVLATLTKHLAARAEARWLVDYNTDNSTAVGRSHFRDWRFNLGVEYSFYTPPPPPPAVPISPPPAAAPPPPAPPADSDGDGVPDSKDECPNTPKGVKVDARGCPLDSDGDGVPDYLDKCPGTPKGFKVDADGCIIEQTVIIRSVTFEFDKDTLTTEAKDTLDTVSAALASQPKLSVEVSGHTDSKGADAYNQKLSKKRAEAVKAYLVGKGVDADRLSAVGYGETKPIASNDTEEGRAENRRVEFKVLTKPLNVKVIEKGPTATHPEATKKKK